MTYIVLTFLWPCGALVGRYKAVQRDRLSVETTPGWNLYFFLYLNAYSSSYHEKAINALYELA